MRTPFALAVALVFAPLAVRAADPRVGVHLAHGSPTHNVVESAWPPVAERGKTTRVTFCGSNLGTALDVWHSLPKGALTAKPVSGDANKLVFDVTARADAPVGVCGLRLATADGLTNAILFHIEDLPVRTPERELKLPACVCGTFREGTADKFRITVGANERVSFECVSNRLGKDADPLLVIRDAGGAFVTERDNDPGLYFDFRFAHTFAKAGTYTLEVRDARLKANEHHHYILRAGKFPAARVALPNAVPVPGALAGSLAFQQLKGDAGSAWVPAFATEGSVTVAKPFDAARDDALAQLAARPTWGPNLFLALTRHIELGALQATPATVPGALCGALTEPGRRQAFSFRLEKGQSVYVRAEARALNSPADLELALVDRTGRELRRGQESRDGEHSLEFTAPSAGLYGLTARDTLRDGSEAHTYRVVVRDKPFPPTVTAEVEGLTVPRGNYQVVPLVVNRGAAKGDIKLSLVGAPPGVKLTPDVIPEGASALVCKLEADTTAPLGVHTLQVVAECGGEKVLVRTRPQIDKKYQNVDLIPIAQREDQMRLAPALADRFAVQVTPPAPFGFELPEAKVALSRYQTTPIPCAVTRAPGFDGAIAFLAVGGQLADKDEGRTRVYAEFPDSTAQKSSVSGVVVSKILSNIGTTRIEITATTAHANRRVSLTRTFELNLTYAYALTSDTPKVALLPGERGTVRIGVSRRPGFDGPVALHLNALPGLEAPETVVIPKGAPSVEFAVRALPSAEARKQNWQLTATADVSGFEEELRAAPVEVEIKKVEPPKKK